MYYTYMLRCKDNSIYTGITTDLKKRMNEHFSKNEKCAKYTKRHTALKLEMVWNSDNRINASKLEYRIKQLSKKQKEELIKNPKKFEIFLGEKINCEEYRLEKIETI